MTLLLLIIIHLSMNYAALRVVRMNTLNRQRANIIFSHLLSFDKVLSPAQVATQERIFERNGVLRWDGRIVGFARIGHSIQDCVRDVSQVSAKSNNISSTDSITSAAATFERESHILVISGPRARPTVHILLKQTCTPKSQLKAWCHALLLAKELSDVKLETDISPHLEKPPKDLNTTFTTSATSASIQKVVAATLEQTNKAFDEYAARLRSASWDLETAALETHSGRRVSIG